MSNAQSLLDLVKHEQGHFDAESILFLDLNCRDLTDVNCLSVCRHLIVLNLEKNQLTQVRGFGTLTALKILSLAENQLTSLDGLQSCESLEILNLAGNNLNGLKSLAPLLPLPQLRSLCLADRQKHLANPLCNSSSYRQDVKNNLPNLDTLDNECLGHSFQEKLASLEDAIEHLENPRQSKRMMPGEKPTIVVTGASSTSQSLQIAQEEYEQLLQTMNMLVK